MKYILAPSTTEKRLSKAHQYFGFGIGEEDQGSQARSSLRMLRGLIAYLVLLQTSQ